MFNDLVAFIRSQYPRAKGTIPLHAPVLGNLEKQYLLECIDSTFVSSVGPCVDEFEQQLCRVSGRQYAIATVNGTAALQLGLHTLGVAQGTEVILQPLTFIATANAIRHCGAAPVFVDIESEALGICPDSLRAWLSQNTVFNGGQCFNRHTGNRVVACLCMHTFGLPSRLQELAAVCREFELILVDDGAEALGSEYRGAVTGSYTLWTALSFNGNKIVTTGGGGALLTDDEAFARRARHLGTTAKLPHAWECRHDASGFNFRMPNINAALGCAQLQRLPGFLADKRNLALAYQDFFHATDMRFVAEPDYGRSNYWLNAIVCRDKRQRDEILQFGHQQHIQMRPAWELLSDSEVYRRAQRAELPVAKHLAERLLNLPSSVREPADA